VQNTEGISGLTKFEKNIYCSPQTFQIINIGSLQFSNFRGKVDFEPKLYFSYFLALV
jgi:hypothetical protein